MVENILKWDTSHLIHVNNHAIFQLAGEYDFPSWRPYLNSLGGSAHASWHFSYFNRDEYVEALAANSEILRSGAGNLPWLMTELQGGGNIYSGAQPLTPTKYEISQWLWTVISTGGKGALFWSLNSRKYGIEAGEWAMTDLNNQSTPRIDALSEVSAVVNTNLDFYKNAKVAESGVNIIYTRESLWAEKKYKSGTEDSFAARKSGFTMKSALGFFHRLKQFGHTS